MSSEPRKIDVGSNVRLRGIDGPGMVVSKVQQGTTGVTHSALCWRYESGVLVEQLIPLNILEWIPPRPLPSSDTDGT